MEIAVQAMFFKFLLVLSSEWIEIVQDVSLDPCILDVFWSYSLKKQHETGMEFGLSSRD